MFTGIIPPLVTPLQPDGSPDLESLDSLVDAQIAAGVHGLFVLGSSGQVAYLTDDQRSQVVERAVARAAGRVPVLAGTADLTAPRVIEQCRRAERAGAAAVVVTAPLYALNDVEEIAEHFRMVAAATSLPVMAYDVPVRVHTKLTAPLLVQLAKEGVVVGVKDSSGDDVAFRMLVAARDAAGVELSLLSGHEVMCDGMYLLGADGIVPGLANVDPDGYVRLHRAAQAGDWEACRAEQDRLLKLFQIAFVPQGRSGDAAGIGAFKQAMASLGIISSATMPRPLHELSTSDVAAIEAILAEVGLTA
ncbi:4-hydroxy-tetrahydrodipicolinate synthase [Luteococcus japonicus]|uniref:4-hydroxy-tetrahydrodipicolinate synthase n=1 Tax=Luteococcus japonicus TaxID=33984 RepID=A0A3N1ZV65_9ACTN|nr:dihydrodipicolinate synthase family protein [Luteococcus japonicus]ROR54741.1 4-hydroxy-tetrahydrodipicolinate synthase [Luteococcus japonicus]